MNKEYAYAYSFLSFIFSKVENKDIKNIILFGSLTRDELDKNSDIDLFIELFSEDKKEIVEKEVDTALNNFISSNIYKEWKLRNVSNPINCIVGMINNEADLKKSLISNGIVLYGKFFAPVKGGHYALFSIEAINEKNKRYRVFRKLFGRNEKRIQTKGIVYELGGEQISTRVFLIPSQQTQIVLKYLRKEKVDYSMKEITKI